MNQLSLISVVITTYNRPELIVEAINSVLNQTYQKFEIIIVDDASTEEYPNLTKLSPKIKYYKLEKNSGPGKARNFGMDKASGKYITILDDDDILLPLHLHLGVQFLDIHKEYHGVYFDCQSIRKGKLGRVYGSHWKDIKQGINPLRSCAMVFRKSPIRFIGEDKDKIGEDFRLWIKFYEKGLNCLHVPIITSHYRKDFSKRCIPGIKRKKIKPNKPKNE